MISFLTKENFSELVGEYRIRFWITVCFFLTITSLVFGGFLFAAQLKVSITKSITSNQISKVESEKIFEQRKELEEKISSLDNLVSNVPVSATSPSFFVAAVIGSANNGIEISGINVDTKYIDPDVKKAKEAVRIELRGMAKNRADLSVFQENLNNSGAFSSVEIPYSNFAKISNIQFTATLLSSADLIKTQNE